MICAVSLNPAVDKYIRLEQLERGAHQTAAEVITSAGGKAINGAGVVRALGEEVTLLGFFGGYTGEFLLRELRREGIRSEPVAVAAATRTAFVVVESDGTETEIVEPGAPAGEAALAELRARLRRLAPGMRAVVLAGSVPPGCPVDIYRQLISDCAAACPVLLDTSREWLRAAAGAPAERKGTEHLPHLIKPNRREAEQFLGHRLGTPGEIVAALRAWRARGIVRPMISDGENGLYAADGAKVFLARPPRLERVNSVGSGDAAVGGFAVGLARGWGFAECLRLAAACGAANVLTKECAQVRPEDVERLLPAITIVDLAAGQFADRAAQPS